MARIIVSLLSLTCFLTTLNAQDIYLKFDENCMDRLEYRSGSGNSSYISYSAKLGNEKFLILDIGAEDPRWVNDVPSKVTYCQDLRMDKALATQINSGGVRLFIVQVSPTKYHIAKVDKASYYEQYRNAIDFTSEDADFVLYTDNLVSDINLAKPSSKSEVYLDGVMKTQCLTGYILKKKEGLRSERYKELVLIPEIGIVEKGSVAGGSSDNNFVLDKVGSQAYKASLTTFCDKKQAALYDGATASAGIPRDYDVLTPKSVGNIPQSYDNPCGVANVDGIHTVQKGETLYAISRRYGLSLAQLKAWNNIGDDNKLNLCQQLYVKTPSGAGSTTNKGGATEGGGVFSGAGSSTGTSTTAGTGSGSGYWVSAPEVHIVRPGESVAQLANMYGYTEERFRKMNSLSPTERLISGQRLHTSDCACPTLESTTKNAPLPYNQETERLTPKGYSNEDVYFAPVKVHLVKKNETLFSIAKQYGTTTDRLLELNGMTKSQSIHPDQRIYVQ